MPSEFILRAAFRMMGNANTNLLILADVRGTYDEHVKIHLTDLLPLCFQFLTFIILSIVTVMFIQNTI